MEMDKRVRIKHYDMKIDSAYIFNLRKANKEIEELMRKIDYDLFDILTLHEISLFINDYDDAKESSKELIKPILDFKKDIKTTLGNYFKKISNSNFIEKLKQIGKNPHYSSIFLECFEYYKVFDVVNDETLEKALKNRLMSLNNILYYEKLVKRYERVIKSILLSNSDTAKLLIEKYDYKGKIFLPSFSQQDKEMIISNYIRSDIESVDIDFLNALKNHIDSKDSYKLTPTQRIEIIKIIKAKYDEMYQTGIIFQSHRLIEIRIDKNKKDVVAPIFNNGNLIITLPGKWIDENLDYPTLLNNFIYVFGYFDMDMNMSGLASTNYEDILESCFNRINKHSYETGSDFKKKELIKNETFTCYFDYLIKTHNIYIEDIIEWFFKEYLQEEFHIFNFSITLSKDEKYINRCKSLFPEIDGVLKKYRVYIEHGYINNEILDATKESFKIDDCPSLIDDKYLIINKGNEEIIEMLNFLFNDQSGIAYINDNLNESTFVELISKHCVSIQDLKDYQTCINKLVDNKIIFLEKDIIKINQDALFLCEHLYAYNYIRYHSTEIENDFIKSGYLTPYSKLFAPEEANYLNYNLNNSKYGDAKALSNKYRHSNVTDESEDEIRDDYLIGLRMMILIIVKINDDLCGSKNKFHKVNNE